MQKLSSTVQSKQTDIHAKLLDVLRKRTQSVDQTPIAPHSWQIWPQLLAAVANYPELILDLGCGTGDSTVRLAELHSQALVIGVDRSPMRISKPLNLPSNALKLRFDQYDLVRLLAKTQETNKLLLIAKVYLLFPNPAPKPELLLRRWHAHPIFPTLLSITQQLELRCNWCIYAQEFAVALQHFGWQAQMLELSADAPALSPFEQKYRQSGHQLYQLFGHRDQR